MDSEKDKNTGTSLIRTVTGTELSIVAFDAAEIALDSVMSEGVLKEFEKTNQGNHNLFSLFSQKNC